jgi:hypothetical protein
MGRRRRTMAMRCHSRKHLLMLRRQPVPARWKYEYNSLALEQALSRLVVNQASALSAGGSLTNGFAPTTTLGCGSWGGNSISENLDYKHLINVSRIGNVITGKKVPTDAEIWAD